MTYSLLAFLLWLSVIAAPQPRHSQGNILIYGHQRLAESNSIYRGYDLSPFPNRCGLSAISPAMLGRVAWVRVGNGPFIGPCSVVDAVAANHAIDSIEGRQEVAEITWDTALLTNPNFTNGGRWGSIYFGPCPPIGYEWPAEPYLLIRDYTQWPFRYSSFYPYPPQEMPISCPAHVGINY